eukprot:TRINITY_DN74437_c0_g1_i2.p1 TRINITY_DN74437_c0_g1~~TRINITY_DN74437_c0_g1_i2.p1  ORF type:complete len:300 (-),score=21.92 TRINITY_DN74437_c0_g1_i2:100-999(-)
MKSNDRDLRSADKLPNRANRVGTSPRRHSENIYAHRLADYRAANGYSNLVKSRSESALVRTTEDKLQHDVGRGREKDGKTSPSPPPAAYRDAPERERPQREPDGSQEPLFVCKCWERRCICRRDISRGSKLGSPNANARSSPSAPSSNAGLSPLPADFDEWPRDEMSAIESMLGRPKQKSQLGSDRSRALKEKQSQNSTNTSSAQEAPPKFDFDYNAFAMRGLFEHCGRGRYGIVTKQALIEAAIANRGVHEVFGIPSSKAWENAWRTQLEISFADMEAADDEAVSYDEFMRFAAAVDQ